MQLWRASTVTPNQHTSNPLAGWEFYTLKDAFDDRPELTYIVEGLIRVPSLSIFFGAPMTFKSMLLADMAACVAAGDTWLPAETDYDKKVQRGTIKSSVMICDFDQGRYETHDRIEALARARELTGDDDGFHYVSIPDPFLDASNKEHIRGLEERILKEDPDTRLLIIDNLRLVSGNIEENNAEMSVVMSNLRSLSDAIQAAVVVIHHQRKQKQFKGRPGDALRGHSSIEASLDLAVLVEVTQKDVIELTPTKCRFGRLEPFGARFTYTSRGQSQRLKTASLKGLLGAKVRESKEVQHVILEVVKDNPGINQGELHEEVDARVPTGASLEVVKSNVLALKKEGRLVRRKAKTKNAWLHFLPGEDPDE
jgi:hypothetical protein